MDAAGTERDRRQSCKKRGIVRGSLCRGESWSAEDIGVLQHVMVRANVKMIEKMYSSCAVETDNCRLYDENIYLIFMRSVHTNTC